MFGAWSKKAGPKKLSRFPHTPQDMSPGNTAQLLSALASPAMSAGIPANRRGRPRVPPSVAGWRITEAFCTRNKKTARDRLWDQCFRKMLHKKHAKPPEAAEQSSRFSHEPGEQKSAS